MPKAWQIGIDTGGTFTDAWAIDPDGCHKQLKVLSNSLIRTSINSFYSDKKIDVEPAYDVPIDVFIGMSVRLLPSDTTARVIAIEAPNTLILDNDHSDRSDSIIELSTDEEAPVLAIRLLTHTTIGNYFPPLYLRLGTTRATNAILERKGARVLFLCTKGTRDLLHIGNQQRPHLFQLNIPDNPILYEEVIEVEERIDATGEIINPLSDEEVQRIITQCERFRPEAIAIALLNSYQNDKHEQALKVALNKAGFKHISASAELSPSIHILPRAQSAVINAYVTPVIGEYLENIREALGNQPIELMTSAGGLQPAIDFLAKDSLLSGPAGGLVGAARIIQSLGYDRYLSLDMGGTSSDAGHFEGRFDLLPETEIDRIRFANPVMQIETVAAGGGSICSFDGNKLQVGPESAGADPGPACYGRGGPLSITDVHLLLGHVDPAGFSIPLDREAAHQALLELKTSIEAITQTTWAEKDLLQGFLQIADEKMAGAIRRISIQRGFDPSDYPLVVFGGAAGLHACQIAELLGIKTIILPRQAGILSAFGMEKATRQVIRENQVLRPWSEAATDLKKIIIELEEKAIDHLSKQGIPKDQIEVHRPLISLRWTGQSHALEIQGSEPEQVLADFETHYRQLFNHWPTSGTLEVDRIRVIAESREDTLPPDELPEVTYLVSGLNSKDGNWPFYPLAELNPGDKIIGPAAITDELSAARLTEGWEAVTSRQGHLVFRRTGAPINTDQRFERKAIELELFSHRFQQIAREMGDQLQRTAFSVNIRDRLDFSCALLDPDGELLVNAPHIPVHLGSLGVCGRTLKQALDLRPGDVIVSNHPGYGGSHLPDVSMMKGVFTDSGQLIGYVINRAHHAEIGGSRPGSMPPLAKNLAEEGVVIEPTYLIEQGTAHWDRLYRKLTEGPWPSRDPESNLADLRAALAALESGEQALMTLTRTYGLDTIHQYMRAIKTQSFESLSEALTPFVDQKLHAVEKLDDGHRLEVSIHQQNGRWTIDLAGTSGVHPGNLNATRAIVHSAVMYVLRILCREEIPLNEGLLKEININIPGNTFLDPSFDKDPENCPAVVGGNTEVSQRLVDTLLKAFGIAACSQGTMNNFLFGNDQLGYYETIGGGAGAGPGFQGRSAVHQHMTNTRITDIEELELRYPVRVQQFSIRQGSGGTGKYPGGDGIVRDILFLEPMQVTLLSQHRVEQPYGLNGGTHGQPGRQFLIRPNGEKMALKGIDSVNVKAGERIRIETPGGGASDI